MSPKILACAAEHPLPDGRVRLLGASRSVTGAMTRVETGGKRLLVDCGLAQGREAETWTFPDAALDVDAVALTHGHMDHVGSLPELLRRGWSGPIFATDATLEIARIVLADSMRHQEADGDVVQAFLQVLARCAQPVAYGETVALDDVSVVFREAGHILGSASVEVSSSASRVVLSGDLGRPGSPILRDYETRWSADRDVDLVVLESTYGDVDHAHDHVAILDELERLLLRALARGGKVLVPAFAIGRTQTLLYHLNTLVESGRLQDVVVAVDSPMGLRVTEAYRHHRDLFDKEAKAKERAGDDPLDFDALRSIEHGHDSRRLREADEPAIVIAGNGMCTGGRIVKHLQQLLPFEETTVLFVGFQAPGTVGRGILDAARDGGAVRVLGHEVPVRAHVASLPGLSAHADRRELVGWLKAVPRVRRVGLHHGEPEAQRAFAAYCRAELGPDDGEQAAAAE